MFSREWMQKEDDRSRGDDGGRKDHDEESDD
jgi:hypothetical protein